MNEPRYLNTERARRAHKSQANLGWHAGHYFGNYALGFRPFGLRPNSDAPTYICGPLVPPTNPIQGELAKATFSNCHLMFLPFCFAKRLRNAIQKIAKGLPGGGGHDGNNKANEEERNKKGPETYSWHCGCVGVSLHVYS